ncbi:MAG: alpha/beta fold hydrolase [Solirubrobacteraceae bacterium]
MTAVPIRHVPSRWHMRQMIVDGTRLRVAEAGSGPPLLLLMGIGGNVEMWGPIADRIRDRRLIAFDAPGTGESSMGRIRRMRGLSDLAAAVLDAFDVPEADVLGYSFGGALAQEFARRHPDRVRRVILGATTFGWGGLPARPSVYIHMIHPTRYHSPRYLDWVAPHIYGGKARVAAEKSGAGILAEARLARPPSTVGYMSQLAALYGWTSLPWLHKLEMPILVLAGDDDPIIPLVNARILACRSPNAKLRIVRGGGHLFLLDEDEGVIQAIDEFLGTDHLAVADSKASAQTA